MWRKARMHSYVAPYTINSAGIAIPGSLLPAKHELNANSDAGEE